MSTSASNKPQPRGAVPGGPSSFGLVALNVAIMAVILGVGAVFLPSLAILLGVLIVLEAAGAFYFANRASGLDATVKAESQARAARGLALLGVTLAVIAIVRNLLG